jgi:hypothetical protein
MAGYNVAIDVKLDLQPLANALADLPKEAMDKRIAWGLNKAIRKFGSAAHRQLKTDTKMVRGVSRLKRGVSYRNASAGNLEATYRIRDKNLPITKAYFKASYSNFGRAGAMARNGGTATPAGASWLSWDANRLGRRTFQIKGKKPVFIRLRSNGGKKVETVRGPNPAEMLRLYSAPYEAALQAEGQEQVRRQIEAYRKAEATVKARYGL